MNRAALPRLYDSVEDAAFDLDLEDEVTEPRIDPTATGIRSFFDRVIAELDEKNTNLRRRR